MKKVISIMLACVLTISLFACGKTTSSSQKVVFPDGTEAIIEKYATDDSFAKSVLNAKCVTEYSADTTVDQMDTVTFGEYPQSDISGNMKEPIEWIVLNKTTDKALLLSKYILDYKKFYPENNALSLWDNSLIRKWLNLEFYNIAFANGNKDMILLSKIDENAIELNDSININGQALIGYIEVLQQDLTEDKIFCLSLTEIKNYFKSANYTFTDTDNRLSTYGTKFAKCVDNEWWTRSLERKTGGAGPGGGSGYINFAVSDEGKALHKVNGCSELSGVRPAMWVSLASIQTLKTLTGIFKGGYCYIDNEKQVSIWIKIGNSKYYLDSNGKVVLNVWQDGHYLGEDGVMYANRKTPDGKFVNTDGDVVDIEQDFKEIDKNEVLANAWFKTKNGIWYYFEGDRTTLKKGWFTDPQDDQTYYLDPKTGIMQTGWQKIDGKEYYFNESFDNEPNWYYVAESDTYESYGKKVKAYGSMFKNETTPDGHYVDANGVKGGQDTAAINISNTKLNGISNMKCVKDYSSNTTFDKMNTITFGSYTQNGNNEPIEWLLLDKQDGKALLISKYVLDCKPYNETSASVNWDNSTLKTWLNNDFMNSVFSSDEKNSILSVTIPSINDMNNYFNDEEARKVIATKYAKDNGCWVSSQFLINGEGTVCYFLSDNGDTMDTAAFVGDSGKLGTWGSRVNLDDCGIRPAIWVKYDGTTVSRNANVGDNQNSNNNRQQLMQKLYNEINSENNNNTYEGYESIGISSITPASLMFFNYEEAKFDDDGNLWIKQKNNIGDGIIIVVNKNDTNNNKKYSYTYNIDDGNIVYEYDPGYQEAFSKFNNMGLSSTNNTNESDIKQRQQLMRKLYDAIKNEDKYYYYADYDEYLELGLNDSGFTDAKFDNDGNLWLVDVGTMDGKGSGFEIIDKDNSNNNAYYYSYIPMSDGTAGETQFTKNGQTISSDEYKSAWEKFENMTDNS